MDSQWVSISEYARHHNVSDMTIRRRIKTGRLKAVLREGKYFIQMLAPRGPTLSRPEPKEIFDAASDFSEDQGFTDRVFHTSRQLGGGQGGTRVQDSPYVIPAEIRTPLEQSQNVTMGAKNLIEFCAQALTHLHKLEMTVKSESEAKIKALTSELALRDHKISDLKQQVEELDLLLSVVEKKR